MSQHSQRAGDFKSSFLTWPTGRLMGSCDETCLCYRLANKYGRTLLVLHFSKRIVFINCLLVNVVSITLTDFLNVLSPSLKDLFQFFSGNQPQNCVEPFEYLIFVSDSGVFEPLFGSRK
jgi:hypothetical protein